MTKLAHIFFDVDMRMGHEGLKDFLKDKRIKIQQGDFIVFINHNRTIIKCFCNSQEAILHVKKEDSTKMDLGIIKYLPKYFDGKTLHIDKAIADNVKDIMGNKKKSE